MSPRALTDIEREWAVSDVSRRRQRALARHRRAQAELEAAVDPIDQLILSAEVDQTRVQLDQLAA